MEKKGYFEEQLSNLGASMDRSWKNVKENARYALGRDDSNREKRELTFGDVVREMLGNVGKDVSISPIGQDFEYSDVIKWVSENAQGNKFYIVKGHLENGDKMLLVFFGNDDTVLSSSKYSKICYVYENLNGSIADLFASGNSVYVKSFKIK